MLNIFRRIFGKKPSAVVANKNVREPVIGNDRYFIVPRDQYLQRENTGDDVGSFMLGAALGSYLASEHNQTDIATRSIDPIVGGGGGFSGAGASSDWADTSSADTCSNDSSSSTSDTCSSSASD